MSANNSPPGACASRAPAASLRALDNVLPLYFDSSIDPELAAMIIDTLSQLSLHTTGYELEIVPLQK